LFTINNETQKQHSNWNVHSKKLIVLEWQNLRLCVFDIDHPLFVRSGDPALRGAGDQRWAEWHARHSSRRHRIPAVSGAKRRQRFCLRHVVAARRLVQHLPL